MRKTAIAIRHVHFEDLGSFDAVLTAAGYKIHYYDAGVHELCTLDPIAPELLVVLGGPIGVYEVAAFPILNEELALLKTRLAARRPTFGICLGAQLIAAALGAAVKASGVKEIGFSPLKLTAEGAASPLRHLAGTAVLHWHGDIFDIPDGGEWLAETAICRNQGFAVGTNIMGVQFHPEVDATPGLERWLIGHAAELASAKIDLKSLRKDAGRFGSVLRDAGRAMFAEWLQGLKP